MHVSGGYCTSNAQLHQQNHALLVREEYRHIVESMPDKAFMVYTQKVYELPGY